MSSMRDLVKRVLTSGYLTVSDEENLRQLLRSPYNLDDLNAFTQLQLAAMAGKVRQQSRESREHQRTVRA